MQEIPKSPPSPGTGVSGAPNAVPTTDKDNTYLKALLAAGVKPSSQDTARSIGALVCQASKEGSQEADIRTIVYAVVSNDGSGGNDPEGTTTKYIDTARSSYC